MAAPPTTMRTRLLLAVLLVACAAPHPQPPRGAVVFSVEGKVENAPFRFGKDDLPLLPRATFRAAPPGASAAAPSRFEGVAIDTVLADKMELKRDADTAIVHGADGIEVPVPLAILRQLRPVLADTIDGAPAVAGGRTAVSLAWPNLDHPGVDTDPRMRWWWVQDVRKIVIQSWVSSYGRALQVPAGAPNAARIGADVLSAQCIGCHRVRGLGGTRGPALGLHPLGVDRGKLRAHLNAVGAGHAAAGLTPAAADAIVAFVDAVAAAGHAPEEPEPERGITPDEDEPSPAPPPTVPPVR